MSYFLIIDLRQYFLTNPPGKFLNILFKNIILVQLHPMILNILVNYL